MIDFNEIDRLAPNMLDPHWKDDKYKIEVYLIPSKDDAKFKELKKSAKTITSKKALKDYILSFHMSLNTFRPHSLNKDWLFISKEHNTKVFGNRFYDQGDKHPFWDFFKQEYKGNNLQGISNGFTKINIPKSCRVLKASDLDKFIEGKRAKIYNDLKHLQAETGMFPIAYSNKIKVPEDNMKDIPDSVTTMYQDGYLHYNTITIYSGRRYSYLHTIRREVRNKIFKGFIEIDLEGASINILYNLGRRTLKLPFMKKLKDHKNATRAKLATELDISAEEVKELLQKLTFDSSLPSVNNFDFKPAYKDLDKKLVESFVGNDFIIGLSKDLSSLDVVLKEHLQPYEEVIIREHLGDKGKKKLKPSDIRAYLFQKTETDIMKQLIERSYLKEDNIFWLHDAIIVSDISEETIYEMNMYLDSIDMKMSVEVIV